MTHSRKRRSQRRNTATRPNSGYSADTNRGMPKAGPLPIAEFEPQLKGLIDQLFIANLHFQIGTGLRKSWREYYREVIQAPVFWQYTIHAHDTMAVLGLCRVYDDTKAADDKCLTLRRLILTVQANPT